MTVVNFNPVNSSATFGERYFYYRADTAPDTGTFAQWRACATAANNAMGANSGTYYADFLYNQMNATGTNAWQWNIVCGFFFDTSSLPDDAVISSATFSLCRRDTDVGAKSDGIGSSALGLTAWSPVSDTNWVKSDRNTWASTRLATDVPWASIAAAGSYTDWTLNASGIAAINKTGYTKLMTRINWDIDNTDPGGTGIRNTICGWQTGNTGQTSGPKLTVTYTLPSAQNNAPIVAIFMAQK